MTNPKHIPDITVLDAIEARAVAERQILTALRTLHEKTGLVIEGVRLVNDSRIDAAPAPVFVRIEVML